MTERNVNDVHMERAACIWTVDVVEPGRWEAVLAKLLLEFSVGSSPTPSSLVSVPRLVTG